MPAINKLTKTTLIDDEDSEDGDENELEDEDLIVLPPIEPVNKSNRVKYRCPCCLVQVWGKPNLLLKCGEIGCLNTAFEVAN